MTQSSPRRPSLGPRTARPTREYYGTPRPASERAVAYWTSLREDLCALVREAGDAGLRTDQIHIPLVHDEPIASVISDGIDAMKVEITELRGMLRDVRAAARAAAPAADDDADEIEEDRFYEVDGEVYRTRRARAGHLYALILTSDGWEFAPGAMRTIRPAHRMTAERAIELSVYLGHCIRCGRELTAEESVARGIGPVCITKI